MAAYLHEVSGGRFQFGIGVAHPPSHARMGVRPGKPLADIRAFVAKLRSFEGIGALPPIILAALRRRMVALAAEIADGVVFANTSLSHMTHALGTDRCLTSMPKLASAAGVSERQTYNVVKELEKHGFIERPETFNTPTKKGTIFRLNLTRQVSPTGTNRRYHYGD